MQKSNISIGLNLVAEIISQFLVGKLRLQVKLRGFTGF